MMDESPPASNMTLGKAPDILFVEADPVSRRVVKDMLAGAGARVIEATPEAVPDGAFALAIVDVDGEAAWAVLRSLRGHGEAPMPTIAIVATAALAQQGQAAGADEVLVEPVAMTALFDAIGRFLALS